MNLGADVLLDTNIVIHRLAPADRTSALSALSIAELTHGVAAAVRTANAREVQVRAEDLAHVRAVYGDGLPFTGAMAQAYGRVVEVARATPGLGPRRIDYLLVATAVHHGMTFMTTDRGLAAFSDLTEIMVAEPQR